MTPLSLPYLFLSYVALPSQSLLPPPCTMNLPPLPSVLISPSQVIAAPRHVLLHLFRPQGLHTAASFHTPSFPGTHMLS